MASNLLAAQRVLKGCPTTISDWNQSDALLKRILKFRTDRTEPELRGYQKERKNVRGGEPEL